MSSPIVKYEELFLDLKHRFDNVEFKSPKIKMMSFGVFSRMLSKINRLNPYVFYIVCFIIIYILLRVIKPKFLKKTLKPGELPGSEDNKIQPKKTILYSFIFSIPVLVYIIIRNKKV